MRSHGPVEISDDDDRFSGRCNDRPVNDVRNVIGAGTFRLGEREDWDTDCHGAEDSEALRAFWK